MILMAIMVNFDPNPTGLPAPECYVRIGVAHWNAALHAVTCHVLFYASKTHRDNDLVDKQTQLLNTMEAFKAQKITFEAKLQTVAAEIEIAPSNQQAGLNQVREMLLQQLHDISQQLMDLDRQQSSLEGEKPFYSQWFTFGGYTPDTQQHIVAWAYQRLSQCVFEGKDAGKEVYINFTTGEAV
jgi:hypothetical protein